MKLLLNQVRNLGPFLMGKKKTGPFTACLFPVFAYSSN
ncbi:hypothetical protein BRIN106911_00320 [Brevibacillus invocatus]